MGLLDQVLGGVLGSRGQGSPSMSPLVKALLMVLATKAVQHYRSGSASHLPGPSSGGEQYDPDLPADSAGPLTDITGSLYPQGSADRGSIPGAAGGGSLASGDLAGGLGGLLAGLGGAGGLGSLLDQFQRSGYGDAMDSWVGRGQNQRLAPQQLAEALGPDALGELEQQTGMGRDDMLSELSDILPEAVDELTPEGRLPTDREIGRWV